MTMASLRTEPPSFSHVPVLLEPVLRAFSGVRGLLVDATVGGAGHAEALLRASPQLRLLGFDRDPIAVAAATRRLLPFGDRAQVVHARFSELGEVIDSLGVDRVDGVLADLGLSSAQLTDPGRGMSFRLEGPLDMRMDPTGGETALEMMQRLTQEELADLIYRYIKQGLRTRELSTTIDLRRAVVRALGPRRIGGVDPATRTFQAVRLGVNQELFELRCLLDLSRRRLSPGGVLGVISFHSLEDRLVKRELLARGVWERLTPKPVTATEPEVSHNPRSRSAKLRFGRRLADEPAGAEGS
jgi:16S rRNA (cytosine1402-N4)-methyltransferase